MTGEFSFEKRSRVFIRVEIQETENVFLCGKEMEIEAMPDMYEHLFKHHTKNFIKCMILNDVLVHHVIEDDIMYAKEEVKAVASITNCMGFW